MLCYILGSHCPSKPYELMVLSSAVLPPVDDGGDRVNSGLPPKSHFGIRTLSMTCATPLDW